MKKNCSGIIVIQDLYINLFNLFLALIYIYTYPPPPHPPPPPPPPPSSFHDFSKTSTPYQQGGVRFMYTPWSHQKIKDCFQKI